MRRRTLSLVLVAFTLPAVLAACGPGPGGQIEVRTDGDFLRLSPRVIFSTVDEIARPAETFTVRNVGNEPLEVRGLSISGGGAGAFALAQGQPTSFTVPAGGSSSVALLYRPPAATTTAQHTATLAISSNDPDTATLAVGLRGLNARAFEGSNEPILNHIVQAFGYNTDVGSTSRRISPYPESRTAVGDEVVSAYWRRVDTGRPVELIPLARYAGRSTEPAGMTAWYDKVPVTTQPTRRNLYNFEGGDITSFGGENQTLLPVPSGVTTFAPSGLFGLAHQFSEHTDDGRNGSFRTHNFRFYPARHSGGVVPNVWLVGQDLGTDQTSTIKNYDYQDMVYLLVNAEPELPATAPAPGSSSLDLGFAAAAGGVADGDGQGTGFTSVQANNAGNQYQPARIDLDTGAGRLRIASTSGTSSNAANSQVNALQSSFDGTRTHVQATTRLVGPFTGMDTTQQHQALFVGPDQNNYFKFEVEFRDGTLKLIAFFEQNGSGSIVSPPGTTVVVPGGTSASVVDLYVLGDADARSLQAAYSVNGSPVTAFGDPRTPTDVMRWFSRQANAGVLVSNQSSTRSFTGTFDSFAVKPR